MSAIFVIAAALTGVLFWIGRRFPGTTYLAPVVLSDGTSAAYYEPDSDGDMYLTELADDETCTSERPG
jgi:hypothetical protein